MKRLRRDSGENRVYAYLNENLSSINFYLLKKMKIEGKKRPEEGGSTFESVFSFEGRVYDKNDGSEPSRSAVLIRSEATLTECMQLRLPRSSVFAAAVVHGDNIYSKL